MTYIPKITIYGNDCGCGSGEPEGKCGCEKVPQTPLAVQELPKATIPGGGEDECAERMPTRCIRLDFEIPELGIVIGDSLNKLINIILQRQGVDVTNTDTFLTAQSIVTNLEGVLDAGFVVDALIVKQIVNFVKGSEQLQVNAGVASVNANAGNYHEFSLTDNIIMQAPTGGYKGQRIILALKQTKVNGSLVAWTNAYRFSDTTPEPILSNISGRTDYIEFIYNEAAAKWDCLGWSIGH